MRLFNPFLVFSHLVIRFGDRLRRRRRLKGDMSLVQDSFTPFSEQSGIPHEAVGGVSRLRIFQVLTLVVFALLTVRMLELKWWRGDEYRLRASTNYLRTHSVEASRGIIYDRLGTPLVYNEPLYELHALPASLPRPLEERQALAYRLTGMLELDFEMLFGKIENARRLNYARVPLRLTMTREQALALITEQETLPGIEVNIKSVRRYTAGDPFAHILGYMTEVNETELVQDGDYVYEPGDRIGRDGLERQYEGYLRGIKGRGEVEVDAAGRLVVERVDPAYSAQAGHNLLLTLDLPFQSYVHEALAQAVTQHRAKAGVAIVMDVNTGEIRAIASYPSFDNNLFSGLATPGELAALYDASANAPLFDRSLAGLYPPASTFKVFVAAAALEEGTITTRTRLNCPGFLDVGGSRFRDWIYYQYGGSFGVLDVVGALARSSDVFFYQVGAGYEKQTGLGSDRIRDYAWRFGFGERTGIDLPGEALSKVASASSFAEEGKPWYWGNTAHMAIGQGYTLVTPIALLNGVAAIANGGTLYQPHVVTTIDSTEFGSRIERQPEIIAKQVVDDQYLKVVREGMRTVITGPGGTATALASLPVSVAGKTGTAEHDKRKANHAWFVSYAPYENPEIATVVLLEEGGEGSKIAAPLTRDILQYYFANR